MCEGVSIGVKRALAAIVGLGVIFAPAALAAKPAGTAKGRTSTGYDISYPQCATSYPANPAFGIVGVNGGLANDANQCFASELRWALASPGLTNQSSASVYINTANPGPAPGVTDWPTSGTSPYGSCDGSWSTACSYVYGQARADYSYGLASATNAMVASSNPWWLDIETANSWATSSTSGYTQLNIAAIRGFIAGLQGSGANGPIGVYSTAGQWNTITGLNAQTTTAGLGLSTPPPNWVAGPHASLKLAQSNCSTGGFTGASPTLAQYSSGGYDADLRCS
jgi:hypothetical protein